LRLAADVRAARPDVAFGCDLIAGFPTETDEMFENTLSLIEEVGVAYVHAFPFSPRPGTPAARMPQLEKRVIKLRAERLRQAGDAALARHLDARVGREVEALVERAGLARAGDFTEIVFVGDQPAGLHVVFRITGHNGRQAIGVPGPDSFAR
jgi:threonylcarbamoyladenosine tRNA methylthiotransferase MtaB